MLKRSLAIIILQHRRLIQTPDLLFHIVNSLFRLERQKCEFPLSYCSKYPHHTYNVAFVFETKANKCPK